MKLSLTREDLAASQTAIASIIKAATPKEPSFKPHSVEAKILGANRSIMDKLVYAFNQGKPLSDVELNRQEAKVFISSMVMIAEIQTKTLAEYAKRPDTHPSFSDKPGRRKVDYVSQLELRIDHTNAVLHKIRKAL